MAQSINIFWNNIFINPSLPLLCRNSGAIHLVQPSLMTGWQVDEIPVYFKFLKFIIDQIFKLFAAFSEATALLEQYECVV